MPDKYIYLDHAATTPLDPRVLEAMMPYFTEHFGNPSSVHAPGRRARYAVEESRERVAELLGAEPGEIIFTSGATEANNTALKGVMTALGHEKALVTSPAEHKAVLEPARRLASRGYRVHYLPVDRHARVSPEALEAVLAEETVGLVSLMYVNNETGSIHPVKTLAETSHAAGALFHCDAVQAAGVLPLDVRALDVDLLSLSAHKFYGPKGVGLLYVRGGVPLEPLIEGGAQERRRRGGTEPVPLIVGLARALELAVEEREARVAHLERLRRQLLEGLREAFGEQLVVHTPMEEGASAPHILHVGFRPVQDVPIDGEMLILNLDLEGVAVSSGSACTSGALEPSHVLQAMGVDPAVARATLRFSLGKETTEEEIQRTVEILERVLQRMATPL